MLQVEKKEMPVIAKIIKKAGYSQKEVSDLIGVRENYLNRAIKKKPLPVDLERKLAEVLGVEVQALGDVSITPPFRWSGPPRTANEPGAVYSAGELAELRREVSDLKKIIGEMAAKDDLNKRLLDMLDRLTGGEKL